MNPINPFPQNSAYYNASSPGTQHPSDTSTSISDTSASYIDSSLGQAAVGELENCTSTLQSYISTAEAVKQDKDLKRSRHVHFAEELQVRTYEPEASPKFNNTHVNTLFSGYAQLTASENDALLAFGRVLYERLAGYKQRYLVALRKGRKKEMLELFNELCFEQHYVGWKSDDVSVIDAAFLARHFNTANEKINGMMGAFQATSLFPKMAGTDASKRGDMDFEQLWNTEKMHQRLVEIVALLRESRKPQCGKVFDMYLNGVGALIDLCSPEGAKKHDEGPKRKKIKVDPATNEDEKENQPRFTMNEQMTRRQRNTYEAPTMSHPKAPLENIGMRQPIWILPGAVQESQPGMMGFQPGTMMPQAMTMTSQFANDGQAIMLPQSGMATYQPGMALQSGMMFPQPGMMDPSFVLTDEEIAQLHPYFR